MSAQRWLVKFNHAKSEAIIFAGKQINLTTPPLKMNKEPINEVTSHTHLGIFVSNDETWHEHIDYITSKVLTRLNIMC